MVKKFLLAAFVLALVALDWAALHDILKGNEPDLIGEYAALGFSTVVFVLLILALSRNKFLRL